MNKELTIALLVVIVASVITAATLTAFDNNASAKSNKAFGKCVSNAAKNNLSKTVCNPLKRGHPFTDHPAENETGS